MRRASKQLASLYDQKCQEVQSLERNLGNLRAKVRENKDASQSLALANRARLRWHRKLRARTRRECQERAPTWEVLDGRQDLLLKAPYNPGIKVKTFRRPGGPRLPQALWA